MAGERFTLNLAEDFKDTLADQLGNSWPLKNNRFEPAGFASFAVGIVTPEALYEAVMSLLKGRMPAMSDLEFAAMTDRLSDVNDTEGSALN
ncbi:Uncharacterised protein [BD1-7 clade bacterium]|uniref:Uncharacterized protein n=1 Tax=BD1-7 clade bacterium TaxID=2029982 RepID=A0A5S9PYP4_9GAMM|nr:Uncharacterised protein [BD1-7 clade bacterium]CAA0109899.1 Uncharacterised protein [BD1-7 clade bacterium]CAA0116645.1 Uncharacterised protein [BD1-7 clade bacterium]